MLGCSDGWLNLFSFLCCVEVAKPGRVGSFTWWVLDEEFTWTVIHHYHASVIGPYCFHCHKCEADISVDLTLPLCCCEFLSPVTVSFLLNYPIGMPSRNLMLWTCIVVLEILGVRSHVNSWPLVFYSVEDLSLDLLIL